MDSAPTDTQLPGPSEHGPGHSYQSVSVSGDARVHLGNHYITFQSTNVEDPPQTLSTVPFRRDPDFIECGPLMGKLQRILYAPGSRVALVGLGGVGKSQMAIEYAYRVRTKSPDTWVLWIRARNFVQFEQSVRETLSRLKVPHRDDPQANVCKLFLDWLLDTQKQEWVLILDGLDEPHLSQERPRNDGQTDSDIASEPKGIKEYIPSCGHGYVLITSTNRDAVADLVEYQNMILVGPMTEPHAIALLAGRMGLEGVKQDTLTLIRVLAYTPRALENLTEQCLRWLLERRGTAVYETTVVIDVAHLVELVRALDLMPLAIVQAAAYLRSHRLTCSIPQYLAKLKSSNDHQMALLEYDKYSTRREQGQSNSIVNTWRISFDDIREVRPSAADMLSFMSFCDPDHVPDCLLKHLDRLRQFKDEIEDPPPLSPHDCGSNDDTYWIESSDEEVTELSDSHNNSYEDDLAMLESYSLIETTTDTHILGMHRLVHSTTRQWSCLDGQQKRWESRFVELVNLLYPKVNDITAWQQHTTLFLSARLAMDMKHLGQAAMLHKASLMRRSSWCAGEMGDLDTSLAMALQSLQIRTTLLGRHHFKTVKSMCGVASALSRQGSFEEAKEMLDRTLDIFTAKGHANSIGGMMFVGPQLARVARNAHQFEVAKAYDAITSRLAQAFVGQHSRIALRFTSNIAETLKAQGRFREASKVYEHLLDVQLERLGPENADTILTKYNLALTYRHLSRFTEAFTHLEPLSRQCAFIYGPEHSETLLVKNELAGLLLSQGRDDEAMEMVKEVLRVRETVLGHRHHETLCSMTLLGMLYSRLGRSLQDRLHAESIHEYVYKIRTDIHEPSHPDIWMARFNLAIARWKVCQHKSAVCLLEQCVHSASTVFNEGHPNTEMARRTLEEFTADIFKGLACRGTSEHVEREDFPELVASASADVGDAVTGHSDGISRRKTILTIFFVLQFLLHIWLPVFLQARSQ